MNSKIIYTSLFSFILIGVFSFHANAQEIEKEQKKKKEKKFDSGSAWLIAPTFTAQFPYGNMRERFGYNSLFGLHLSYKTDRNWLWGVEGNFLFGTKVKENYVITSIATSTNQYISSNNDLIGVTPQEQGFNTKFVVGKIIPVSKKFPDAGILIMTSLGFLMHKIAINVRETSLPQFSKVYRKGYDRLTVGPVLSQFIGGTFIMRRKYASAYLGATFDIAFTQGVRNYDFYTMAPMKDKRIDMFVGLKFAWIIPVFTRTSEKEFFYY